MRLSLFAAAAALVAAATPFAAQQPERLQKPAGAVVRDARPTRPDTAAILRAATDSGWRLVGTHDLRIVGDTATLLVEQQKQQPFGGAVPGRVDSQPVQLVVTEKRVERRNGRWIPTLVPKRT